MAVRSLGAKVSPKSTWESSHPASSQSQSRKGLEWALVSVSHLMSLVALLCTSFFPSAIWPVVIIVHRASPTLTKETQDLSSLRRKLRAV